MNDINFKSNQTKDTADLVPNAPLFRSKINLNSQIECINSSNFNDNPSVNLTQKTENARSFLSIFSKREKVNLLNTQTQSLSGPIDNPNYIQIPLNSLLTQYQNQNLIQENKNAFFTNLNSVSQNQILGPIKPNNFSESEGNEMFKIQEKLRKFPQLFNNVFEKRFNLGFPAFTKTEDKLLTEHKKASDKTNTENKIYLELKETLIKTNQKTKDLATGQKEAYMDFCYLVLRIKEKILQAKNCSFLLSKKLEFYLSLNEKLIKSVAELNQIFRFGNYNNILDQGSDRLSELQAEKEIETEISIKAEFEIYLEILKNLKMSEALKANFIKSNPKLNEALEELNKMIDERIKLLDTKFVDVSNLKIICDDDNKTATCNTKNSQSKMDERQFVENIFEKLNAIMNEVNDDFQSLIEKEKIEAKQNFSIENFTPKYNQNMDLSKKNDLNHDNSINIDNPEDKCNKEHKKTKNSKLLEKIFNRKPTLIQKEISNYFTNITNINQKRDVNASALQTMNKYTNSLRYGNNHLGFFF